MLNHKRIIYALVFMIMPAFVLLNVLPTFADAVFDGTGLWEDGAFHVFMVPPETMDEKYTLNEMITDLTESWGIVTGSDWGCNEDFTSCRLVHYGTEWTAESYDIVYEYDAAVKERVDELMESFVMPEQGFIVHDTELLKYWVFGGGSLGEVSSEVKTALQNKNLEFTYDARGGAMAPLESSNIGMAKVIYNGSLYKIIAGMPGPRVIAPHIFYVPTGTSDEDKGEALIDRFVNIYGEDARGVVSVSPTGEVAGDLVDEWYEAQELFDDYLDEGVYSLDIDFGEGISTHKIIIVADSDKMSAGSGVDSTDLMTDINIKTDAVNLPGDTMTYAFEMGDDLGEITEETREKLGEFYAYEIGLHSNAVGVEISDSDEGFIVSIPVPESLRGFEWLSAYWINFETGEPEEHYARIAGKYAVFETNHFSTYILAESSEDRPEESDDSVVPGAPNTGTYQRMVDSLAVAAPVFGAVVMILGIVVLGIKKNN